MMFGLRYKTISLFSQIVIIIALRQMFCYHQKAGKAGRNNQAFSLRTLNINTIFPLANRPFNFTSYVLSVINFTFQDITPHP